MAGANSPAERNLFARIVTLIFFVGIAWLIGQITFYIIPTFISQQNPRFQYTGEENHGLPSIYEPISILLTNKTWLQLYATEVLFESHQVTQIITAVQRLESPEDYNTCLNFKDTLRRTGEDTNRFLSQLDMCLDYFTDDSIEFGYTGDLGWEDESHFYHDALLACLPVQAFLKIATSTTKELLESLNNTLLYVEKAAEKLGTDTRPEYEKMLSPLGLGWFSDEISNDEYRNNLKRMWKSILSAHHDTRREEAVIELFQRLTSPLEETVHLLKAAQKSNTFYVQSFVARFRQAGEIFKMLAYKHALSKREKEP